MRSVPLVLIAWLASGVLGIAIDPFVPLAATLALAEDRWLGRASALALAPIAAAIAGLPAETTLASYAIAVGVGTALHDSLAPGPKSVLLLVTAGVLGAAATAWLATLAGTPMAAAPVLPTLAWSALYASLRTT
ncbi:MAG: hypothetical protein KC912_03555 [Proteobacteria bacterium]|nr:hypothetical protein [Pseudomonadota bacterium]